MKAFTIFHYFDVIDKNKEILYFLISIFQRKISAVYIKYLPCIHKKSLDYEERNVMSMHNNVNKQK